MAAGYLSACHHWLGWPHSEILWYLGLHFARALAILPNLIVHAEHVAELVVPHLSVCQALQCTHQRREQALLS